MEQKILELFTKNTNLKFNEIEKSLHVRSNKLNYHLKKLVHKKILIKEQEYYKLTETSEYLIPYLSNKHHVLTIILIHLGNNKEVYLTKRTKRPYKDQLGLPGGRMILGENIPQATKRIMKEKYGIHATFKKVNSVTIEHLLRNKKTLHTYLLVYVTAQAPNINLTLLSKEKKNIIPSDLKLITKDYSKKAIIKEILSAI